MTAARPPGTAGDPATPPIRVAMVGGGFWARPQLAAWGEHPGAKVVAIANRTEARARALAEEFGVPGVYDDLSRLLDHEQVDVVDIVSASETHPGLIRVAADRGLPVICQKPLALDLETARAAAAYCAERGVTLLVHENFRWQLPFQEAARELRSGAIGKPFRARIEFTTGYPVLRYQPIFATLQRLIVADLGTHLLDVARFLFGEARTVTAQTHSVNPGVVGEDVATIMLAMERDVTVVCDLSFYTALEADPFPETLLRIEGSEGTIECRPGLRLAVTRGGVTTIRRLELPEYPWVDRDYAVSQSATVTTIGHLLGALRGEYEAETTAADNLRTLALVEAAYEAATTGRTIVPADMTIGRGPAA